MAADTARLIQCPVERVLVASTGVIGLIPDIDKIKAGIASVSQLLSREGHGAAAQAIMTTDPWPKETAVPGVDTSRRIACRGHGQGCGHD